MELISTRDRTLRCDFRQACANSLAPDGGLWVPERLPPLPDLAAVLDLPWPEQAVAVLEHLIGDEFAPDRLRPLVRDALDFPVPLVQVTADLHALELWHGPTLAFKDFGARLLARLLAEVDPGPRVVLTATSGDTGAAVAHAFWRQPGVQVVVLYPAGRVSPLQERQFGSLGDNVHALAVEGNFDDCQALAKACFAQPELTRRLRLTSANSIHIARLLAQVTYYFAAAAQAGRPLAVAVPSGNFGNLCAGIYARQLGLPMRLVAATNANTTVPDWLDGGPWRPRASIPTLSSAMDVGAPSNWERVLHTMGGDREALRAQLDWGHLDDISTLAVVRGLYATNAGGNGYLCDPHGAVAAGVLRRTLRPGEVGVFLATAHPAKFGDSLAPVVGEVPLPPGLTAVRDRPLSVTPLANDLAALVGYLTVM
jgi:threonine synthase